MRVLPFADKPIEATHQLKEALDDIVRRLSADGHSLREIVQILRDDHGQRKSINTVRRIVENRP